LRVGELASGSFILVTIGDHRLCQIVCQLLHNLGLQLDLRQDCRIDV
jgi:hypothetical protein